MKKLAKLQCLFLALTLFVGSFANGYTIHAQESEPTIQQTAPEAPVSPELEALENELNPESQDPTNESVEPEQAESLKQDPVDSTQPSEVPEEAMPALNNPSEEKAYAYYDASSKTLVFTRGTEAEIVEKESLNPDYVYRDIETTLYSRTQKPKWQNIKEDCTIVRFEKEIHPVSAASWFDNFTKVTSIENLICLKTEKVTDMQDMFFGLDCLESLDVSHIDTSNVTNMSRMFGRLKIKHNLDLHVFNTEKVTDMSGMFIGTRMSELDLSSFNTSNVTTMRAMFSMSSIQKLDLSHFDTSNVEDMAVMFGWMNNIKELDVSSFDTSNVKNMISMFFLNSSLEKINLSSFDTSNVLDLSGMFSFTPKLKYLDLSKFTISENTSVKNMFQKCGIEEIDLGPGFRFKTTAKYGESKLPFDYWYDELANKYDVQELADTYNSDMAGKYIRSPQGRDYYFTRDIHGDKGDRNIFALKKDKNDYIFENGKFVLNKDDNYFAHCINELIEVYNPYVNKHPITSNEELQKYLDPRKKTDRPNVDTYEEMKKVLYYGSVNKCKLPGEGISLEEKYNVSSERARHLSGFAISYFSDGGFMEQERFKVPDNEYKYYLALIGKSEDPSQNIPDIPKDATYKFFVFSDDDFTKEGVPMTQNTASLVLYHNIVVNYYEIGTNKVLAESVLLENLPHNSAYDVSVHDQISIDGYEYVKTTGDPINGTLDSNKVINVYYKKEKRKVVVNYYEIGTNKVLHEQNMYEGDLNSEYDVTKFDKIKIEGYSYVKTERDSVKGTLDCDKVIDVYYKKEKRKVVVNYYEDGTNKVIHPSNNYEGLFESAYDVSKFDKITIDGYTYVQTEGDSLKGNLDTDKVINVYYKKVKPSLPEKPKDPDKGTGTSAKTNGKLFLSMGVSAASLAGILSILKRRNKE